MSARDVIAASLLDRVTVQVGDHSPLALRQADKTLSALRAAGYAVVRVPDAKTGNRDVGTHGYAEQSGWNACRDAIVAQIPDA